MKILFILHVDFEQPGILESWALENKFEYQLLRPFAGETLPDPSTFAWLISMGGPQDANANLPYLKSEIELIQKAKKQNKMILGFCLGAQLIGEALGAATEKSPHKELGVFPIKLTNQGKNNPLLQGLKDTFAAVHWHNDMPGLTPDAQILASSEGCPRQIIRYAERVYGFQCHLEPTIKNIENMIQHCEADLKPGRYVQTEETLLHQNYSEINQAMIQILDNLLVMDLQEKPVYQESFIVSSTRVCILNESAAMEVFSLSGEKMGTGPGLHIHHIMDEIFYVISGDFEFQIKDELIYLKAGQKLTIPHSTPHRWQPLTQPWKLIVICKPPKNQINYLRALAKEISNGKSWDASVRNLSQDFDVEIVGDTLPQT